MSVVNYSDLVQLFPSDVLVQMAEAITVELRNRNTSHNSTKLEDLRERYGADGNRLLQLPVSGYHEHMLNQFGMGVPGQMNLPPVNYNQVPQASFGSVQTAYELNDLPFSTTFDIDFNKFVYRPTGHGLKSLQELFGSSLIEEVRRLANDDMEIFIDPTLLPNGQVHLHNAPIGSTITIAATLRQLVDWYNGLPPVLEESVVVEPLRYIGGWSVHGDQNQLLLEYDGKSLEAEGEINGNQVKGVPFRANRTIQLIPNSNIPELMEQGRINVGATIERLPAIKSVYVEVGGHMLRAVTKTNPTAQFQPSLESTLFKLLDMRLGIELKAGMTDCFGEIIEWSHLLGDETITLDLTLAARYNPDRAEIVTTTTPVEFIHNGPKGSYLSSLLSMPNCGILAFDLSAVIETN
ncbi:hypothetical protein ST201phi2-1p282 [Pseudomonas phage 201phi2-1]|uniref:Uncharacterized protein n=1 Tax=Pseudomonas phage 201phi2-1 TaxID=198110 RepID=B3FJE3_BP201|nr:hypothetical protein ST201phi2-1p282 [Pseudomonas phage 201phi2-1]ABY63109.1 hypothetical protein 201phi2-1p282 [Pseudomonas phage 201phi2-1]